MKHAKIFLTFLIILSCFTTGFSMTALAGNDNVAFSFILGGVSGIVTMCLVQINRVNGNERFEEDDFDEERY